MAGSVRLLAVQDEEPSRVLGAQSSHSVLLNRGRCDCPETDHLK